MKDLDKLLEQAGASAEQRARMYEIFTAQRKAQNAGTVAHKPTSTSGAERHKQTAPTPAVRTSPAAKETIGGYIDLGILGSGGMGEVRRVLDPVLNRRLAMKIIHSRLLKVAKTTSRFTEEAKIVAQLQHPNIIPIHEIGKLDDGRLFFTMKEVKGRPFSEIIAAVHAASTDYVWQPTEDGWSFRKLLHMFSKVCAATAFAHSCGVVHRDLKPENILVGKFGEVLVVDWGIAKIVSDLQKTEADSIHIVASSGAAHQTQMGSVAGTPAYMAPEQARGQIDKIDARTDVYALGAILYEILSGQCPYGGTSSQQVLNKVILGPPPPIRTTVLSTERITETIELDLLIEFEEANEECVTNEMENHNEHGLKLPEDLINACEKSMQRNPSARYQSAEELQQAVLDWLNGAKKRDQALKVVEEAEQIARRKQEVLSQVEELLQQSKELIDGKPQWSPEEEFFASWSLEDRAKELSLEARLLAIKQEQLLQSALTHANDLQEAHQELVALYQKRHTQAEISKQQNKVAEARFRMEYHNKRLPVNHPTRVQAENYLAGFGRISIVTEHPGAEVFCAPFTLHNRRLVLSEEVFLGHTPLHDLSIGMGSYALRIRQTGFHEITYPIKIERQGEWSGRDPDGNQIPIRLPPLGSIADDECFVPGGPFICGGDNEATESLPPVKVWVDDFIIKKFQITYQQYQHYLQDLYDNGYHKRAQAALPVAEQSGAGSSGKSCFEINDQGVVQLVEDATGNLAQLDWPIAFVSYNQAVEYCQWLTEKTGKNWRILNEFEWEKAARGVDGRYHPWGNNYSPAWSNCMASHPEKSLVSIDSFPIDCSVYGVRAMAGNLSQWTSSKWIGKPDLSGFIRVPKQTGQQEGVLRTFRGGCWMVPPVFSRCANRVGFKDSDGMQNVGFRVGRTPDWI